MAETTRGAADFEIKDYQGTHWILVNIGQNDFPELNGGFAGLDIKPGTAYEDIVNLVKLLREHVTGFTLTKM